MLAKRQNVSNRRGEQLRRITWPVPAHEVNERHDIFAVGALRAWRKAGHPVERVPHDDLVKLPTFG